MRSTSSDHTSLPSLSSLWCLRWGVRDLLVVLSASDMHLSFAREVDRADGEGVSEGVRWTRTRRDMRSSPMRACVDGRYDLGMRKSDQKGKGSSELGPLYKESKQTLF